MCVTEERDSGRSAAPHNKNIEAATWAMIRNPVDHSSATTAYIIIKLFKEDSKYE